MVPLFYGTAVKYNIMLYHCSRYRCKMQFYDGTTFIRYRYSTVQLYDGTTVLPSFPTVPLRTVSQRASILTSLNDTGDKCNPSQWFFSSPTSLSLSSVFSEHFGKVTTTTQVDRPSQMCQIYDDNTFSVFFNCIVSRSWFPRPSFDISRTSPHGVDARYSHIRPSPVFWVVWEIEAMNPIGSQARRRWAGNGGKFRLLARVRSRPRGGRGEGLIFSACCNALEELGLSLVQGCSWWIFFSNWDIYFWILNLVLWSLCTLKRLSRGTVT